MRVHTGVMPYDCNHCGETFRQKNSLNYHMRTRHPEELPKKDPEHKPEPKKRGRKPKTGEEENDENVKKRVFEILQQYDEKK